MYVIVAGGGRTGISLARFLINGENEVHIIENRPAILAQLHREIPTELIHEGNPMDPLVMEQAGIKKAQVIAAVTTSDEDNLVICYMARARYQIDRTIARINNPRDGWLFGSVFNVDVAVNEGERRRALGVQGGAGGACYATGLVYMAATLNNFSVSRFLGVKLCRHISPHNDRAPLAPML